MKTKAPRVSAVVLLVGALFASLLTTVTAVTVDTRPAEAGVLFNTDDNAYTYKEYWADHSTFTGGCDDEGRPTDPGGGVFYIEPTENCLKEIELEIPDNVQNALRAVIYVNLWRNRASRSARFTINDGPQIRPTRGSDFSRNQFISVIDRNQLRQGTNVLKFQQFSGAYHVHDVKIRVYYTPTEPLLPGVGSDVTPPSGALTRISAGGEDFDPAVGGVLNVDSNQVTLEATATGGDVAYVEFHAFHEGFDEDNDGVTRDWHNFYRNNFAPGGVDERPAGPTVGHVGTDRTSPYQVTWNLPDVVNQTGVKFKIRVVDTSGNVRETALPDAGVSAEFALTRSYSVETYTNPRFRDAGLHFDNELPREASTTVDLPTDLSNVTRAFLIGNYWLNPRVSLNGFPTFDAVAPGGDHWQTQMNELDINQLRPGTNTLYYSYRPPFFGQMVEKPGPMIVIHRAPPAGAPVVTSQPNDVVAAEGTRASFMITATGASPLTYQWLRNGTVIPGATAASYTTPALTLTDNEATYSVVVSNGSGSATSEAATLTVAATQGVGPWFDEIYRYRLPVTVSASGSPRQDHIVEMNLNFSDLMSAAGSGGPTFDPNSVRVVEVDAAGNVLNDNVPRQLDRLPNYDAVNRAEMSLVFMMTGTTAPNRARRYHVYFDKVSQNIPPVVTAPQVEVTEVVDQGFDSYRFALADGSAWVFHKQGGGFARVFDRDGNDWVAWNPAAGAAGDFRGVPNSVRPQAGGFFHPGRTTATTTLVTTDGNGTVAPGPLRTTLRVEAGNGAWVSQWNIYPTKAQYDMLRAPSEHWFLYEGLPGGAIEAGNDVIVRSDGVQVPIDGAFETDLPGQEWMYAADQALGRSFFMAHHQDDGAVESYRLLSGQMTVLGFGRFNNDPFLTRTTPTGPHRFTVGLLDSTAFAATGPQVRGAYQDVDVVLGTPEFGGEFVGPFSDSFGTNTLQSFWRYEDPAGDVPFTLSGQEFVMDIPGGSPHNVWTGVDRAPRLMQNMGDTDFDLMVKFNSRPDQRFEGQGLLFRSPDGDLLRFTLEHNGTSNRAGFAQITGGTVTNEFGRNFSGVMSTFLRVVRVGDTFTFQRSRNGTTMVTVTTVTVPFEVAEVGVFGLNDGQPPANSPAFPVVVDYFRNMGLPGFDNDAPAIENVNVTPSSRGAVVTWTTTLPAPTAVEYGPSVLLGQRVASTAPTTDHRVDLEFLDCNTPYFVRIEAASASAVTQSPIVPFTTADCVALVSDDFSGPALRPHWRFVNPPGVATLALTGTNAIVSIPAGVPHNLFVDDNNAVRFRQEGPVGDFQAEAKFDSVLSVQAPANPVEDPRRRFQMQGIVVEQDRDTFLRFEVHDDGTGIKGYVLFVDGANTLVLADGVELPSAPSHYVRVTRVGNTWLFEHSTDGSTWTEVVTADIGMASYYVSPYLGTTVRGNLSLPAFIGSLDYFFNTASPIDPEDGGATGDTQPPVISGIAAAAGTPDSQTATISWVTDEPSTTRVVWGTSPGSYPFGPVVDNVTVLEHSAVIGPLNCGTTYQFRVSSIDPSGNEGQSPNQTLVMPPCPTAIESDDFSSLSLDPRWVISDPRGNGTVTTTGGLLRLTVPGGARHNLIPPTPTALRVTQPVPDTDFQVEAKFESAVNFNTQIQGLVFESDAANLVRFELRNNGAGTVASVGRVTSTLNLLLASVPVGGAAPATLRVTRVGTEWTFEYSANGTDFTLIHTGTLPNSVARIGPFAGNDNARIADVPPHTALVDYFFNTASPIDPEDGSLIGDGPQIELWTGSEMQVGNPGVTQPDLNIMGRVADPDGVASLRYSLNGAEAVQMGIGPDSRRLLDPGDFNANIPLASLNPGLNSVVLRALDGNGNETVETVEVAYTPGSTWPIPYSVDWSTVSNLGDVAKPVDGRWVIEGDNVRAIGVGYDRLLAFGDSTWGSFEATVPITVNEDPGLDKPDGGAGVGFIPHWRGHVQHPGEFAQPPWGFSNQLGALAWYRWLSDIRESRLEIRDAQARPATQDLANRFSVTVGVPFLLKLRAETAVGAPTRYSLKAWPQGTPEPVDFQLVFQVPTSTTPVPPDSGSLLLVAHHVDATFGDLTVTRLTATTPAISPAAGTYPGLVKVAMTSGDATDEIRYTLDGSEPTETSELFTEPFLLTRSATVKARSFRPGFEPSPVAETPITITEAPGRVTEGQVALYTFDEGTGQVIRDSSQVGQPLDLRVVSGSPEWLPEGGLRLSGPTVINSAAGAAKFTDAVKLSRSFAIETWLDPVSTQQLATVVDVGSGNAGTRNVALTQRSRAYEMAIRTSNSRGTNGLPFYTANGSVRPELHHVVFQRRSTLEVELWIDGQLISVGNRNGLFTAWNSAFRLSVGGDHTGGNLWQGDLRLLALYGRSLTAAEVAQNFQSGPGETPPNGPPVVSAGDDVTIVEGEQAQLSGVATDDGRPLPSTLTTAWTATSGPGTVTFADPAAPTTTASFSAPGVYVLELSANDGELSALDQVTVTVIAAGSTAAAPQITPAAGAYTAPVQVTITTATPGAEIRYTTDGTDPTAISALYAGPFMASTTTEIRARAFRSGLEASPVTTASYQITVTGRVSNGLRALYEFNETSGNLARDTSGVGTPLNLTIAQPARTTWVGGGLQIRTATRLRSAGAAKVNSAVRASGEVTVEGWIQPAATSVTGGRVMTISATPTARNLALVQSGTTYDWLVRSRNTNGRGEPPLSMGPVAATEPQHVAVTRDRNGITRTYLNGVEVAFSSLPGDMRTWVNSHRITVGAEANGASPWLGTIFSLAIYSRALTPAEIVQNFSFGRLEIPAGLLAGGAELAAPEAGPNGAPQDAGAEPDAAAEAQADAAAEAEAGTDAEAEAGTDAEVEAEVPHSGS